MFNSFCNCYAEIIHIYIKLLQQFKSEKNIFLLFLLYSILKYLKRLDKRIKIQHKKVNNCYSKIQYKQALYIFFYLHNK